MMILKVIFSILAAGFLAGGVYVLCRVLEIVAARLSEQSYHEQIIAITATKLGREMSVNPRTFQSRYYLRIILVAGKVTASNTLPALGGQTRHRVELDGVICCEFNEFQDWVREGKTAEISGLCLGKILTGCRIETF